MDEKRESGRVKELQQKRVLDEAARRRRQRKALEALEQDNFQVIPDDVIDHLLAVCHSNSYEKLQAAVQELMYEGHAASQLLIQIHDKVVKLDSLGDKQKSIVLEKLAVVDKCLMDGAEEFLQMMALCSIIMQQICIVDK